MDKFSKMLLLSRARVFIVVVVVVHKFLIPNKLFNKIFQKKKPFAKLCVLLLPATLVAHFILHFVGGKLVAASLDRNGNCFSMLLLEKNNTY